MAAGRVRCHAGQDERPRHRAAPSRRPRECPRPSPGAPRADAPIRVRILRSRRWRPVRVRLPRHRHSRTYAHAFAGEGVDGPDIPGARGGGRRAHRRPGRADGKRLLARAPVPRRSGGRRAAVARALRSGRVRVRLEVAAHPRSARRRLVAVERDDRESAARGTNARAVAVASRELDRARHRPHLGERARDDLIWSEIAQPLRLGAHHATCAA
jgi:hypothetical protein